MIAKLKDQFAQMRQENGADHEKFVANQVIDEFWDYSEADRQKAIKISNNYAAFRNAKEKKSENL